MITYNAKNRTFYLETESSSYIIGVLQSGIVTHIYYGTRIPQDDMSYYIQNTSCQFSPKLKEGEFVGYIDTIPQEISTFGRGDFRESSITVQTADGRELSDLRFESYEIINGKPIIEGLPQLNAENSQVQTLKIVLTDSIVNYQVILYYSVFYDEDIIARHTEIKNLSRDSIKINKIASAAVDMKLEDFEMLTLEGEWGRERNIQRYPLHHGTSSIESRRGSSSHMLNPFAALLSKNADEDHGEVYGFSLVYSGDFKISAELGQSNDVRVFIGINPETFSWELGKDEIFSTPEALLVYSNKGLTHMSHCFHNVCRKYLGKSANLKIKRPIIINSWEAMYFDMNEAKIKDFINECKGLGIDTFVLDDGWFGNRNNDDTSLGDWYVDRNKFPNGLYSIIDTCKENNIDFGIWIEPEMISKHSNLYRMHPDWCIHSKNRTPIESRNQLVLDFARGEVVDYIYNCISNILNDYDISYVKWDMNRNITDNGSEYLNPESQKEHSHRYMLGVYNLMDRLVKKFPNVLFEGCSGGGGRFDFGVLYYMPQIWTSDDTDACERLNIQYGTSVVYPPSSMVGHVSACPNHQTERVTPFKTRGDVAQICNFGYELDISKLSNEEKELIKVQTDKHHQIETMILTGDFYRLSNPFEENLCAWQIVSNDRKTSFITVVLKKSKPNPKTEIIKLKGLNPNMKYFVSLLGISLSGATLMNAGLHINMPLYDYASTTIDLAEGD